MADLNTLNPKPAVGKAENKLDLHCRITKRLENSQHQIPFTSEIKDNDSMLSQTLVKEVGSPHPCYCSL